MNIYKKYLASVVVFVLFSILSVGLAFSEKIDTKEPDAKQLFNKGISYQFGQNKDLSKALVFIQKAANKGHLDAQYHLAQMHEDGIGTESDMEKALQLYLIAAEHDDAKAMYPLGMMHEEGLGVSQNSVLALKWYIIGAERHGEYKAVTNRDRLLRELSKKDILIARTMADQWEPKKKTEKIVPKP